MFNFDIKIKFIRLEGRLTRRIVFVRLRGIFFLGVLMRNTANFLSRFVKKPTGKKQMDKIMSKPKS